MITYMKICWCLSAVVGFNAWATGSSHWAGVAGFYALNVALALSRPKS